MQSVTSQPSRTGLILTGGGARSAYQVGVLKAIAELLPRNASCPFSVITGTSAGAVSAIALASDAAHFRRAIFAIERVWRDFHVGQVFKADTLSMLKSGLHWLAALLTGGWLVSPPHALFDNSPLWELLRGRLNFDGISRSLYKEHLHAICVCATSYSEAISVAFYHCATAVPPWQRTFRKGARVQLTLEHLMASLAIPFLFRPVVIGGQYFGDGSMRQTAPLSAAIHLGADRLLVIGVRESARPEFTQLGTAGEPTFGQMFGFMLDTLFMDQIFADIERMNSVNDSLATEGVVDRRHRIESLMITPSRDLSEIARRHAGELPFSLRALLRTLGANNAGGQQLISYLLFERAFTRELIALGYEDGRQRAAEIRDFLKLKHVRTARLHAR
jgi:NTE family protein